MWRGDKGALLCEKVERLPAHGARLIRDDVIDDGHPGARKLDGAHMYGVAYEDHGIRAAAHSEEGGPGRMAGMYRRSNARQDFLAVIEGLQPPSIQIGPKRSEEHTSELPSLMRISYAVFCLKKKKKK